MFTVETDDPDRLKRIAATGGGGILVGLLLVGSNLLGPLFGEAGYTLGNVLFGLVGIAVVVLATYPTYQAALRLDAR